MSILIFTKTDLEFVFKVTFPISIKITIQYEF